MSSNRKCSDECDVTPDRECSQCGVPMLAIMETAVPLGPDYSQAAPPGVCTEYVCLWAQHCPELAVRPQESTWVRMLWGLTPFREQRWTR